jgi:hypothetical protein
LRIKPQAEYRHIAVGCFMKPEVANAETKGRGSLILEAAPERTAKP